MNKSIQTGSKRLIRLTTRQFWLISLIFVAFAIAVPARNLAEYGNDIGRARSIIARLLKPSVEDTVSAESYRNFKRKSLSDIRTAIPTTERIEWEGTIIETDNLWLAEKLKSFEDAPQGDDDRSSILTEIDERLQAIAAKIAETTDQSASPQTKDEDKRKLAEILRREEFQTQKEEGTSLFQRIVTAIEKWFDDLFPTPEPSQSPPTGMQSLASVLQILLVIGTLAGLGFLIYKFAPALISRTRQKRKTKERFILGEKLEADQDASGLLNDAELLAREGNLRGAIRKGYIALLCELSDRRIIGLAQHKTNRDYLRDVRTKKELYQDMTGLTLNFERHWYGVDEAEAEDWEEFKNGYQRAVSGKQ